MNELTDLQKLANEALENGYIEHEGKKYYHRISFYYLNCDSCPVQDDCCYYLSKLCMEYESLFRKKWGLHYSSDKAFLLLTKRPHMKVDIDVSTIKEIEFYGRSISFNFNDGFWVNIGLAVDPGEEGSWECQADPEDAETYCEGGLWFNGEQIQDYDGCYDLPNHVKTALSYLGYHIS